VDQDERRAGSAVSEQVVCTEQSKLFLFFYDSIKAAPTGTTPPIMNASPRLIQGVDDVLQGCVPIIGAGVVGDFQFSPTTQFCGYSVGSQQVVGALLGGDVAPYYRIMHGCTPMDGIYHRITRIDGPVIYEVDGKPVVDMIDELYGDRHWREQRPVKRLTIGVNLGDKFGAYREGNYVNRLIMGVLPAGEGIVIFEPDLSNGTEILFMLRDSEKMLESVRENSTSLLETVAADGKRPAFALYIDCAGRAASFSETLAEEALEIRNTCNRHEVPLLGFYSGVEVAPLLGKSRGLDWTGVLLVLAEG
jgi:small ligand-binding sensory domain FIST